MDEFRSVPEEVGNLLREIEATKASLKEISTRLTGIEKHVRRAFQVPTQSAKRTPARKSASLLRQDQLLELFDNLRSRATSADTLSNDLVAEIAEEDLRALAQELGVPNVNKQSAGRIRASVLQKVRESVMLGTNSLRGIEHAARESETDATRDRGSDS
jgi:hypothetical protein